jgi:hypothetical protein
MLIQKDLSNIYVKKLNYKSMMSTLLFHHFIDPRHLFKMSNTLVTNIEKLMTK